MKNSIIRFRYAVIALILTVANGVGALASTPWTVNPADYRYDMSLYLDVSFVASGMDYSLYDVGAFCGDECRGIAEVLPLGDGRECLYLRVRSNRESGEMLTFRYYNRLTEEEQPIDLVTFPFEQDTRLGLPSEPYGVTIVIHYDITLGAAPGGSLDQESGRVAEGTELTVTAIPSEGYHFTQWSDGVTDNPRVIVADGHLTLEAGFEVNSYRLTYLLDGEIYSEQDVDYGTAIQPEGEPEKEGYTFTGWSNLPATMPAGDVTVEGTFTVNSYRLTLYLNKEVYLTETLEFGAPVTLEVPEVPEGMEFKGWEGDIPEFMPACDVEIYGTYGISSSVEQIQITDDTEVTICNLQGQVICRNVKWEEIAPRLNPGLYLVNGRKILKGGLK
ncbi:MAG: InlB B-repeat-containing protein [Muribaculaceae bacterium]|nr:InlB B-repeat-containing protein [Muribaculaceae bacterium]